MISGNLNLISTRGAEKLNYIINMSEELSLFQKRTQTLRMTETKSSDVQFEFRRRFELALRNKPRDSWTVCLRGSKTSGCITWFTVLHLHRVMYSSSFPYRDQ